MSQEVPYVCGVTREDGYQDFSRGAKAGRAQGERRKQRTRSSNCTRRWIPLCYANQPGYRPIRLCPVLLSYEQVDCSLFTSRLPIFIYRPFASTGREVNVARDVQFVDPPSIRPTYCEVSTSLINHEACKGNPSEVNVISIREVIKDGEEECLLKVFFVLHPHRQVFSYRVPTYGFLLRRAGTAGWRATGSHGRVQMSKARSGRYFSAFCRCLFCLLRRYRRRTTLLSRRCEC